MKEKELPFGSQFSPNVVDLKEIMTLVDKTRGKNVKELEHAIYEKFYDGKAKALAYNCKVALCAYEIIDNEDIVVVTSFGDELIAAKTEDGAYEEMAKHILQNLNGLALIDTLRKLFLLGEKITNETVNEALIQLGYNLQKTSNYAQVMKLWLEKAYVLDNKWNINEQRLSDIIGIKSDEISLFKELSQEQYYFLMALVNVGDKEFHNAIEIRELAIASYGISFGEKAFANQVLKPLEDKGLITVTKTTEGRGSKPSLVRLTGKSEKEIIEPLLEQFRGQVGNALAEAYCKSFTKLREDIDDKNTYKKGLALEAFAIKVMGIIGLNFQRTRYRDKAAGGEVDVILDSTRLMYSRWQVQCKNTKTVTIDQVAKEVGLSHVLKSNCIVMMTTGHLTSEAIKYSKAIMEDTNLCILTLQKEDIEVIIKNPASIIKIFNHQAESAKKIKVLNDGEQ